MSDSEWTERQFRGRTPPARSADVQSPPQTKLVSKNSKIKGDSDLRMFRSRDSAKEDLAEIENLHPKLKKAAEKYNVPVEILAGMASRESRAGKHLNNKGYDKGDTAFGILQVDERYHKRQGKLPTDQTHIDQAAGILRQYRNTMDRKHGDWSDEDRWKGAIAAYNMGPGNVRTREKMDEGTTGGDYSTDVLHRSELYGAHFAAKKETK